MPSRNETKTWSGNGNLTLTIGTGNNCSGQCQLSHGRQVKGWGVTTQNGVEHISVTDDAKHHLYSTTQTQLIHKLKKKSVSEDMQHDCAIYHHFQRIFIKKHTDHTEQFCE